MNGQRSEGPDELHDLAAPYALDALDGADQERFEAHLATCPACRAEVDDLREIAVGLSEGLELAPPPALRERLLEQVAAEAAPTAPAADDAAPGEASTVRSLDERRTPQHRTGPDRAGRTGGARRWWLAAAAAVVVGAGAWGAVEVLGQGDPADRIVQAQDARTYEADTPDGQVSVVASADEDAAVLRLPGGLAAPPAGQVYQAWWVGADGSARSAGLIAEDVVEDGQALLEGGFAGAAAVGLTVEPAGGSQQPTSEPFAVVPLG